MGTVMSCFDFIAVFCVIKKQKKALQKQSGLIHIIGNKSCTWRGANYTFIYICVFLLSDNYLEMPHKRHGNYLLLQKCSIIKFTAAILDLDV